MQCHRHRPFISIVRLLIFLINFIKSLSLTISFFSLSSLCKFATMVVLSQPALDFPQIKTCKPTSSFFNGIPVIDLSSPKAKTDLVNACEEFGFFKVINHDVPVDLMTKLESEATKFFNLSQSDKDKAGLPDPLGYGSKKIGPNGDIGWIEYLLFSSNPEFISQLSLFVSPENPEMFSQAVNDYVVAVKGVACEVLELIAEGLELSPINVLSKLLKDEESDSFFRLNHYPPCQEMLQALSGRNFIGFGEHTDPQIISVLRSNSTSGLQISLKDGTWVSVPSDQNSFFINVGDSLQVLTNGRFKSVKHRVLADSMRSRVSMIYFGGAPLSEKIAPISQLLKEGEESLYKEFTWVEYKKSAYKTRLADHRLGLFEKKAAGQ